MESVLLDTPAGIEARLAWNPSVSVHDRRRILARQLVVERLGVEEKEIRVEREAPRQFGYHTQLIATRREGDVEIPITIKTASFRAATVVAIGDPAIPMGIDIRDMHPEEADLRTMRRHSHLLNENDVEELLTHWVQVQAVLEADGRGVRVSPEYVKLDNARHRGWVPDRRVVYSLKDLSRDGWIVTLAYGALPV